MRDLLVTLLFCYGGIKALRYPFIAALLWTWIGLMNPHRLGWGFAYNLPFAMISVGLLVVSMMAHPKLVRWPSSGPVKVLVCFLAWMGITTLAAFHVPESATSYVNELKVLGVTLLVGCVIRTREEILAFIAVTVLSVAFFGMNDKNKFGEIETYGGKLTENIVQAIARDCLAVTMLKAEAAGIPIVLHVHDEVIAETDDAGVLDRLYRIMAEPIEWAPGLPLKGAGFIAGYYKKD